MGDFFRQGGMLMWPILLTAIAGLIFFIERIFGFRISSHCPVGFDKDVVHLVDTRGVDAGLAKCLENDSSLGRLLYAALLRHHAGRQDMETAIKNECVRVQYDMSRNVRTVGIMSLLAPCLGILGTCVGMVHVLDTAAVLLTGTSQFLATGAAAALLPTVFGLIVALMLACQYIYLKSRVMDIMRTIEQKATDAIVSLDRKARHSIRMVEDIEEQLETQDMQRVRIPDLENEFDDTQEAGAIKTNITTHSIKSIMAKGVGVNETSGSRGGSPASITNSGIINLPQTQKSGRSAQVKNEKSGNKAPHADGKM